MPPRPFILLALRVLAFAGLCISGYLLSVSWSSLSAPLGCGPGSACDAVLSSRWSNVVGVPVSLPAVLSYLAVLGGSSMIAPPRREPVRQLGWLLLLVMAGALLSAAMWFVALQAVVLRQFCPWCMASHSIGATLAFIVLGSAPIGRLLPRRVSVRSAMAGMTLVAVMAAVQITLPVRPAGMARLNTGAGSDTRTADVRRVTLFDNQLALDLAEQPVVGKPDAPHVLVMLFDYCCPHCRTMHAHVEQLLARHPERFVVAMLPAPLHSTCNPMIEYDEERFKHSCELTRTVLAVHRAEPGRFREMDRWMFKTEQPRTPEQARQKAIELVGEDALHRAVADPWIDRQIKLAVTAMKHTGVTSLPMVLGPKITGYVGRTHDAAEFIEAIETELGVE